MDPTLTFNNITDQYQNIIYNYSVLSMNFATRLFALLALIEVSWCLILWMLNKRDPQSLTLAFIEKMMAVFFFWGVLINYEVWLPVILGSFQKMGVELTGISAVSSGDIFSRGLTIFTTLLSRLGFWGFLGNLFNGLTLITLFLASLIFFVFLRVAVELILIIVGGKLVLGVGLIMLGFYPCRWTKNYAERYFTAAITLGVKLLFIIVMVGIGQQMSDGWILILQESSSENFLNNLLGMVGGAVLYYYLALHVPAMAASMLTGNFTLGFGHNDMSVGSLATGSAMTMGTMGAVSAGALTNTLGAGKLLAARAAYNSTLSEAAQSAGLQRRTGAFRTLMGQSYDRLIGKTVLGNMANRLDQDRNMIKAAQPQVRESLSDRAPEPAKHQDKGTQ